MIFKDNYEEEFEEVITTVRSADGSLEIKREEPSPKRRRKQVMRSCLTKLSTDGALASTSATAQPLSSVNDQPLTPPSSVHSSMSTSPPPPISGVVASKKNVVDLMALISSPKKVKTQAISDEKSSKITEISKTKGNIK